MHDLAYMEGKRDLRLDFLRGYAIFVMTLTHLGMASPLIVITGGSRFLINAAEVFFFISGFTIGYIAVGRTLESQVTRRLARSWLIYRYILFFSFVLTVLLGHDMLQEEPQGEIVQWLVSLIALKDVAWEMDILIAYVVYVALAPLALWGLYRQRTRLVLAAMAGIYLLTQLEPWVMSLEFASFRHLAANTPLFGGAIVLGYHHRAIGDWWRHQRWGRWIDGVVVVAGVALLVAFLTDYGGNTAVQDFLGDFGVREFLMPPHSLAIVTLYLRLLWLLVTHLWPLLIRIGGWLFMPLGRDSLFAYCMQVTYINLFDAAVPLLDWEAGPLWRLLAEALVVGAMWSSVLLRRWGLAVLRERNDRAGGIYRYLLDVLVWGALVLLIVRMLLVAEPGGWWWEVEDYFGDF